MGVVVGVDGSPPSAAALRWASEEAALRGLPLTALHAWKPPAPPAPGAHPGGSGPADGGLEDAARELLRVATAGTAANPVLVRGMATSALLDAGRGADLLVVGTSGRLGSVARYVVAHATCPVVVVPA